MFCEKCGKQINDDAAFCPYCGYTVGQPAESTVLVKAESTVKTSGRKQPIDLFGSSRMTVCLGIGFALLVVLEVINWYFMSVVEKREYGTSYAILLLWFRRDRGKYWRLNIGSLLQLSLMPVVYTMLTFMLILKKQVFFKIATIYGIIVSFFILAYHSYDIYVKSLDSFYFDSYLPYCIRAIIASVLEVLFFTMLFTLNKSEKRKRYIITNVATVVCCVAHLLLLTDVIRVIRSWEWYADFHFAAILSIIVCVVEALFCSLFIWHLYRQASARNEG